MMRADSKKLSREFHDSKKLNLISLRKRDVAKKAENFATKKTKLASNQSCI
jgi:hypothetical protein